MIYGLMIVFVLVKSKFNCESNESTKVQTLSAACTEPLWRYANSLQVATVDNCLSVVGYHYLVYSQAAPVFIQHLCLMKLSNYVMQLVHNCIVVRVASVHLVEVLSHTSIIELAQRTRDCCHVYT